MKKTAFKKIAEMDEEELQTIYELTYKYGWLVSEERQEGWLPDRAYLEKAKIEGELNPWIDYGIKELLVTYDEWLGFHLRDNWVETMMETSDSLTGLLGAMLNWTKAPTSMRSEGDVEERILEAAYEALDWKHSFMEDTDYIYETYGVPVVENYISEINDVDQAEKLEEEWENLKDQYGEASGAEEFISQHDLEKQFEEQTEDVGDFDDFESMYSFEDLPDMFPQLLNDVDFLRGLYDIYLDIFNGLEEEIADISRTRSELTHAENGSLQDKIIAFQLGLTTAHHHGTMADHLLEVSGGSGEQILDEISSGPKVDLWNKELEQIIGFKSPTEQTPEYFVPASSLHSAIACLESVLTNI